MASTMRVSADNLSAVANAIFEKAGLLPDDAATVAACLVAADLRGTPSHGVIRLPALVRRLQDGGARARPTFRLVSEAPATALLDADYSLGPIAARRAMLLAIDKAAGQGIGLVGVRNSDFFGTCAYPAMMAADRDMIGFVWTNGAPGMAPWGGRKNRIGNNPLGFAVPRAKGGPIVLDMAMSVSAGGRIRLAAERGERIPIGWAVDHEGKDTDDPLAISAGGALLSLGHKGYGLAVIGEILAGILPGARTLDEIPAWFRATREQVGNGHIHLAIDIARFVDPATFKAQVDALVASLKATPTIPGIAEILVPGERASRTESEQRRKGVALLCSVAKQIAKVGEELRIDASLEPLGDPEPA
jgi:LDH2 family malate/lactate/ureidoglycolate dehydrogenase